MELWHYDATDLAALIRAGKVSAREATASHLARLDAVNPKINAVVHRFHGEALADADAADRRFKAGEEPGPLHGVPITIKLTADQKGQPSDSAVIPFKDLIAPEDAPVVRNLRKAGAIIIGRTNSPAFAMRFMTDNALHGLTLNPWNRDITCGGSSGGAGAATAVGIGALAHGTDIGGSIRWPAYCNGIVGLRTTPGRIPSYNSTARTPAPNSGQLMAVAGPMTRSVRDARLGLKIMASEGHPADPLWLPIPLEGLPKPASRKVALVASHPAIPIHSSSVDAVRTAGRYLSAAGYDVEEVSPPGLERAYELWETLGMVEVRALLEPMLGMINDPGMDKAQRSWWVDANKVELKDYFAALGERHGLMKQWGLFLEQYPLVITPVGAVPSAAADQDTRDGGMKFMLDNFARFLFPAPVLGLPVLAMPVGSHNGMPQGVQIYAAKYREDLCLEAGEIIEAWEGPRAPVDPKF